MFTTLDRPRIKLGKTLKEAIRNQRKRLKEHEKSGQRMSEFEGVILEKGKPVYDLSPNGVVWTLIEITRKEYDDPSDLSATVNHRTVWFDREKIEVCKFYRQRYTSLLY